MTKDKAEQLLKSYLDGTCSPEEKRLLENFYMDESAKSDFTPEMPAFLEKKAELWTGTLQKIKQHKTGRVRQYYFRWKVAAAILLILASSWWLLNYNRKDSASAGTENKHLAGSMKGTTLTLSDGSEIILDHAKNGTLATEGNVRIEKKDDGTLTYQYAPKNSGHSKTEVLMNTMATSRGHTYKLTLPDGTDVWLNGGSSITYPASFEGKERIVSVAGEAYFEVQEDAGMPFIVQSGNNRVRVLGTAFNVSAYPDETEVTTTLVEGRIQVWKDNQSALLKPGQWAVNSRGNDVLVVEAADIEAVTAWKEGYFYLGNKNIKDIMKPVSRWYDVEVEYRGDMSGKSFGGKFLRSLGLPELLKCLESAGGIRYKIEGRRVIIMP